MGSVSLPCVGSLAAMFLKIKEFQKMRAIANPAANPYSPQNMGAPQLSWKRVCA